VAIVNSEAILEYD